METAISLPDHVFEAIEALAEVTFRLDAIYGSAPAQVDPVLQDLQPNPVGTGRHCADGGLATLPVGA